MMKLFSMVLGWFTGGTLDRVLNTIEHRMDNEVEKEKVKADVTRMYVEAQTQLLVGRTWWFQLFFVVPAGLHWASLCFVSAFPQYGWTVHALPAPFDEWYGQIVLALFLVDGGKSLIGRVSSVLKK